MDLSEIRPFSYGHFCERVGDFAQWMTEYVQNNRIHGYTGWAAQFKRYQYSRRKGNWKDGVSERRQLHVELHEALKGGSNERLLKVVNDIVVRFGGVKAPYELQKMPSLRKALATLSNEANRSQWTIKALQDFTPNRVTSFSKVYEMFNPHKWTIYDARVATAVVCLVWHFWEEKGQEMKPEILRFPVPRRNKKNWQRPYPNKFPRGKIHQRPLAFIYASWLARQAADILRSNSKYGCPSTVQNPRKYYPLNANWQVYHVEMALWMLGDSSF